MFTVHRHSNVEQHKYRMIFGFCVLTTHDMNVPFIYEWNTRYGRHGNKNEFDLNILEIRKTKTGKQTSKVYGTTYSVILAYNRGMLKITFRNRGMLKASSGICSNNHFNQNVLWWTDGCYTNSGLLICCTLAGFLIKISGHMLIKCTSCRMLVCGWLKVLQYQVRRKYKLNVFLTCTKP